MNEESIKTAEIELADLRERNDAGLVRDVYDRLFLPSILLPEERQSFDVWTRRLAPEPLPIPQPHVTAVAAGYDLDDPQRRRLAGYVLFEHYRESRVVLLAYVGVDPAFRRMGLMRRMMRFGFDRVRAAVPLAYSVAPPDVRARGIADPIRAAFAEIHVPGRIAIEHEPMETLGRVRAFAAIGAALVPIHYIQPALEPGQDFGRDLMLIALPVGDQAAPKYLPASALRAFFDEYFRSCDLGDPAGYPEYREMIASLDAAGRGEDHPASEAAAACCGAIEPVSVTPD